MLIRSNSQISTKKYFGRKNKNYIHFRRQKKEATRKITRKVYDFGPLNVCFFEVILTSRVVYCSPFEVCNFWWFRLLAWATSFFPKTQKRVLAIAGTTVFTKEQPLSHSNLAMSESFCNNPEYVIAKTQAKTVLWKHMISCSQKSCTWLSKNPRVSCNLRVWLQESTQRSFKICCSCFKSFIS